MKLLYRPTLKSQARNLRTRMTDAAHRAMSLEAFQALGARTITIDCDVLQADAQMRVRSPLV